MGYRGEDLDLRTPQGWGGQVRDSGQITEQQPNWWTRSTVFAGGRADPLWVDDVVMASCNHAFDLAVAHRAPEVRLEHLINAMTLNEAAQASLDTRGIKVAALRRDSAQVIAGELPVSLNGRGTPRKSDDLEEVLRLAADRAYPRRTPVTIDDVLSVLFDSNRALPAVALLMRHAGPRDEQWHEPPQRWDGYGGRGYGGDSRYADGYEMRRPLPAPVYAAPAPDHRALDRLDALDRAVRDLAQDSASDRKALSAAVVSIQTALSAQNEEASKRQDAILRRLEALEIMAGQSGALTARLGELDRSATLGLDRMARLERLFGDTRDAVSPLTAQVADLGQNVRALADLSEDGRLLAPALERLATLEHLTETRAAETGRTIAFIGERLRAFEEQIAGLHRDVAQATASFAARGDALARVSEAQGLVSERLDGILAERFTAIEASLAEGKTATAEIATAHVQDLIELHDALEKLSSNQTALAGSLEQWRLDTMGDLSIVSNRLATLEAAAGQPLAVLQQIEYSLEEVRAATAARRSRWSRFKMWLFGTEDWRSDVGLKNTRVGEKLRTTLRREKL